MRARRKQAAEADVMVTNYRLLFCYLNTEPLRQLVVGRWVVFDEAHQYEQIIRSDTEQTINILSRPSPTCARPSAAMQKAIQQAMPARQATLRRLQPPNLIALYHGIDLDKYVQMANKALEKWYQANPKHGQRRGKWWAKLGCYAIRITRQFAASLQALIDKQEHHHRNTTLTPTLAALRQTNLPTQATWSRLIKIAEPLCCNVDPLLMQRPGFEDFVACYNCLKKLLTDKKAGDARMAPRSFCDKYGEWFKEWDKATKASNKQAAHRWHHRVMMEIVHHEHATGVTIQETMTGMHLQLCEFTVEVEETWKAWWCGFKQAVLRHTAPHDFHAATKERFDKKTHCCILEFAENTDQQPVANTSKAAWQGMVETDNLRNFCLVIKPIQKVVNEHSYHRIDDLAPRKLILLSATLRGVAVHQDSLRRVKELLSPQPATVDTLVVSSRFDPNRLQFWNSSSMQYESLPTGKRDGDGKMLNKTQQGQLTKHRNWFDRVTQMICRVLQSSSKGTGTMIVVFNKLLCNELEYFLRDKMRGLSVTRSVAEHMRNVDDGQLAILIGMRTLTTGVDLKGKYLVSLIMPHLPNAAPDIVQKEWYMNVHGSGKEYWRDYHHITSTEIRQTIGRVIRSAEDEGLVFVLDKRFSDVSRADASRHYACHFGQHSLKRTDREFTEMCAEIGPIAERQSKRTKLSA